MSRALQSLLTAMAERKEQQPEKKEEDLAPPYFAALGTGSPKPRRKYGRLFCSVEGAFENKTLNFNSGGGGKREGAPRNRTTQGTSQLTSESQEQGEASRRPRSAPTAVFPLTPASGLPPSVGEAEELSDACQQVTN